MDIYIINLKRSADRKAYMTKQIESKNIKGHTFHFFEAIDGQDLSQITEFDRYNNDLLAHIYRGKPLKSGERACFASHFSLWHKCIELDRQIAVIEDDVEILDDFENMLDMIQHTKYPYVRLFGLFPKQSYKINDDFKIFFGKVCGTQGYVISPHAAKKLIAHARYWYCAVDDYMDMFYIHDVINISLDKYVLKDTSTQSEIDNLAMRGSKPKAIYKIVREISRLIYQIRKIIYIALRGGKKAMIRKQISFIQ